MFSFEEIQGLLACFMGLVAIGFGIIAIIGARQVTK